jgi:hypothetical protein
MAKEVQGGGGVLIIWKYKQKQGKESMLLAFILVLRFPDVIQITDIRSRTIRSIFFVKVAKKTSHSGARA